MWIFFPESDRNEHCCQTNTLREDTMTHTATAMAVELLGLSSNLLGPDQKIKWRQDWDCDGPSSRCFSGLIIHSCPRKGYSVGFDVLSKLEEYLFHRLLSCFPHSGNPYPTEHLSTVRCDDLGCISAIQWTAINQSSVMASYHLRAVDELKITFSTVRAGLQETNFWS